MSVSDKIKERLENFTKDLTRSKASIVVELYATRKRVKKLEEACQLALSWWDDEEVPDMYEFETKLIQKLKDALK